ncbi:Uncharacterised protein g6707 [Pycnogonum litorale]
MNTIAVTDTWLDDTPPIKKKNNRRRKTASIRKKLTESLNKFVAARKNFTPSCFSIFGSICKRAAKFGAEDSLEKSPSTTDLNITRIKEFADTSVVTDKIEPRTSTPNTEPEDSKKADSSVSELCSLSSKRRPCVINVEDSLKQCRMHLAEGRARLEQLKTDIASIKSNILTAQKMFDAIDKSIQDYKWEKMDRDVWQDFSYMTSSSYSEMISDHRIFIAQMKFHFKWNHGLIL